jgi:hypothetical protein
MSTAPSVSPDFSADFSPLALSDASVDSGFGVDDLLYRVEASSSPIANSGSNSVGSGPRTGVPVFRRVREERWLGDRLRPGGRRAEFERARDS